MKERIRQLMKTVEMSQLEFANKLEIAPASLSNIFTGKTNPTNNHVVAIHRAFPEINISWLLFGEGDMYIISGEEDETATADEAVSDSMEFSEAAQVIIPASIMAGDYVMENAAPKFVSGTQKPKRENIPYRGYENVYQKSENIIDKPIRKIKEIRVFFDDGTYESFVPSAK